MKSDNLFIAMIGIISLFHFQLKAQQLMNLDSPTGSRFTVTEKTWPENHGQAEVCLWQDDKLSAFTITIDDNPENDIPFWESMKTDYGFNFTWFVITEADAQYNVSDWSKFVTLANAGHVINGHDDKNWTEPDDGSNPTDAEYLARLQATKDKIDAELVGTTNLCRTYAYPYGIGNETEARKVFIGIRGVNGILNKADEINYLNINSVSSPHITGANAADEAGREAARNTYVLPLIDKTATLYNQSYYRGWGSTHFHSLYNQELKDEAEDLISYLKNKEDKLWIATFSQVAAYGQSRDSHTLNVTNITDDEVRFDLTDQMNDTYFNFPLTIKIRVNNTWTGVSATQNGSDIEAELLSNNGNAYVLVKAVPDAGETVVSNVVSTGFNHSPVLGTITADNVNVYPNPARNGQFTISFDNIEGVTDISALNLEGKIVFKKQIFRAEKTYRPDIKLPQGSYIIRIENNTNIILKKLIVR